MVMGEIAPLLLLIAAVVLGVFMIPIGVLYTLGKPFYDYRKKGFKTVMKRFGMWFLKVMYQVWNVIKYTMTQVAYIIDLLGNVIVGELIEDIITAEEDTWFGRADRTISASVGKLLYDDKLNKTGILFAKFLDLFEKNHCLLSYHWAIEKEKLIERLEEEV